MSDVTHVVGWLRQTTARGTPPRAALEFAFADCSREITKHQQPSPPNWNGIKSHPSANYGDQVKDAYVQESVDSLRCFVSHHSSSVVLVVRVELIRERSAPNALPTLARAQRIPALDHKALDISVELRPVVVATALFVGDSVGLV